MSREQAEASGGTASGDLNPKDLITWFGLAEILAAGGDGVPNGLPEMLMDCKELEKRSHAPPSDCAFHSFPPLTCLLAAQKSLISIRCSLRLKNLGLPKRRLEERMDPLQLIFAVVVILLMLGLGATLTPGDFRRARKVWKAPLVAVLCQFVFMPLISFGLAIVLGVTKAQGISMLVVGCSPGGSTSNLFTYYSRGDLPLSIIATSLSTLLSVGLLPLCLLVYSPPFTDEHLRIPFSSLVPPLVVVRILVDDLPEQKFRFLVLPLSFDPLNASSLGRVKGSAECCHDVS